MTKSGLKILMLSWEYPPCVVGGLSRHVYSLSVHLAKAGHEVHVVTAGNEGLPTFEVINGVHVHRVIPVNEQDESFLAWIAGLNLAMAFEGEQLAKMVEFDLIHAHDWLVGASALLLKELLSIPLLSTIHATEHGRNNGIHTEIQRFIHERERQLILESDHVIVCSDYMRESLSSIFFVEQNKISVLPNGIDSASVQVKVGEIFPKLKQRKYIFSIGRMVREKGFDTIIEAASIAKQRNLNYYFIVAGKGPMLANYQKQIEKMGLTEYVNFIGFVTDEQRSVLISGCEMAVFPSLYEPFGIVALETMVFGKPTIVSNTGGLQGIVQHLQTGLLMNLGSAQSLLDQVTYLKENPKKSKEIGTKGKNIALSLYGWKRIASESANLMMDLVLDRQIHENEGILR
ncbi:glycosyltransferase family 4 protein [Neobacillus dielmonensis]|uniref:glycosyltransferase family 4 protein n=1 Tax=Neobacillus dielmonensis TaxID=1347369 RepID=UPI000A7796E5|nr:glycosyltransferase family 4 protein [Neobacillus dielmonensis]